MQKITTTVDSPLKKKLSSKPPIADSLWLDTNRVATGCQSRCSPPVLISHTGQMFGVSQADDRAVVSVQERRRTSGNFRAASELFAIADLKAPGPPAGEIQDNAR